MGKLVAYSGFSATNYLEMPYNSDLDFGTGDFCVMGWVKGSSNGTIVERTNDPGDGRTGIQFIIVSALLDFKVFDGGTSIGVSTGKASGFEHVCAVRSSDILSLYVNGELVSQSSGVSAYDVSGDSPVLAVGERIGASTFPLSSGSLALWRISATAPSAEQIAKIYNDEKVLFQENAAATLYGASDAVTALAHDSDTDLLHVGTSAGRSVFRGLERLSNTTTSVSTAISATGGLVISK